MSPTTHDALPDDRNADVIVYVDGEWLPRSEAKISVFDSAFLVGDGVWEGLRYHEGSFAHLDRHLDRLFATAEGVRMELPLDRAGFAALLQEVVDRNDMQTDAHVRLMVTRGTKRTPLQDPRLSEGGPTIVMIAEHKKTDPETTSAGIGLVTSTVRRPPPDTLDQRWNTHSKIHEVVALQEAIDAGADEALMLDIHGYVATCNSTNFFIVRNGELWTSTGEHCLNGLTRQLVLDLAADLGITTHERDFVLYAAHTADEAFVTGTYSGITPVTSIDDHRMGSSVPGPITRRLIGELRQS